MDSRGMRRMKHTSPPAHKIRITRPQWDDTVHDLAAMRLSPTEMEEKLASRMSSNLPLARAELLGKSRRLASQRALLTPSLASKLQSARLQSVEDIVAQSAAALTASQLMRQTEAATARLLHDDLEYEAATNLKKQHDSTSQNNSSKLTANFIDAEQKCSESCKNNEFSSPVHRLSSPKGTDHSNISQVYGHPTFEHLNQAASSVDLLPDEQQELSQDQKSERSRNNDNMLYLEHSVQMVISTCRVLWEQLEDERQTREHLKHQLQFQGNVINNLTAELVQIQEQQEAIFSEVQKAHSVKNFRKSNEHSKEDYSSSYEVTPILSRSENSYPTNGVGSHVISEDHYDSSSISKKIRDALSKY